MSDLVTCSVCASVCATCNGTASNCLTCIGAFLYSNTCVNNCPTGYFSDANLTCQNCDSTAGSNSQCTNSPLTYTLEPLKD
jgi:hypothetical protein